MHRFGSRLGCELAKVKSLVLMHPICAQTKLKVCQGGKSLLLLRPAVATLSTAALRYPPTHTQVKVLTANRRRVRLRRRARRVDRPAGRVAA